jgi:hypothetical protein
MKRDIQVGQEYAACLRDSWFHDPDPMVRVRVVGPVELCGHLNEGPSSTRVMVVPVVYPDGVGTEVSAPWLQIRHLRKPWSDHLAEQAAKLRWRQSEMQVAGWAQRPAETRSGAGLYDPPIPLPEPRCEGGC